MHIGIASPISIQKFLQFFYEESLYKAEGLKGLLAPAVDTLAVNFLNNNNKVSIYTLSNEVNEKIILEGPQIKIYVNPLRKEGWKRALTLFKKESKLIEENINKETEIPDILHAHWTYEYAMGVMGFEKKIPVVITVRDWAPKILRLYPNYYRFSRLLLNNKVFNHRNCFFIANSPYIQQNIKKYWNIEANYIPNPVESHFIVNNDTNVKEEKYLISISNNLGKGKNIKILLKAFNRVLINFPNLRLMLVGAPFTKSNPKIKKWEKEMLLKNVELKGVIDHEKLVEFFGKSFIMVHPSLEESFGNTIIEAMAQKVAVIGGKNSGAVPYLLQYGKNGLLTDVNSVNALKESIIYLIKEKTIRNKLTKNAYNFVLSTFTEERVVEQTLQIYNTLINEKN